MFKMSAFGSNRSSQAFRSTI